MRETFDGFDRISQVADFVKTEDFIDWIEKTEKRERTKRKNLALKIGTEVDGLIKGFVHNPIMPTKMSAEVGSCFQAFTSWGENYSPSIVTGERLFNKELGITGEPDLYLNNNEISDIKCSIAIRPSYWLQLGGYLLLPIGFEPKQVSILRLSKSDGSYEYKVRTDLENLKTLFISALNLYREFNKGVEK